MSAADDRMCECGNEAERCKHHKPPQGCGGSFRLHARLDERHLKVCIPCGAALAAGGWRLRQDPHRMSPAR